MITTATEHSPPSSEITLTICGKIYATAALPNRIIIVIRKCYGHGVFSFGLLIPKKKQICSRSGQIFSGRQNDKFSVNPTRAMTIRISLLPGILSRVTTICGVLSPRAQYPTTAITR